MNILDRVTWNEVIEHYSDRLEIHHNLERLFVSGSVDRFVRLALGISDKNGNYSAHEHGLGPRVLSSNPKAIERVFRIIGQFRALSDGKMVPDLVQGAQLSYFKIGVGSEASCMINPRHCWVTNTRSLWTFLLDKHDGNFSKANEELKLYRDNDDRSEMHYKIWKTLHLPLKNFLSNLCDRSEDAAKQNGVSRGEIRYLWADCVANWLYAAHHE
ncbi:hypothetical protein [Mesorhizobium metallidurans]|nr:hypothetical protein [Mesorhizobium metallidurans]